MRNSRPDQSTANDSAGQNSSRRPVRSGIFGSDWPWIAAVLLVAFVAAWPAMSQPGLLNTRGGGDSPFLLQRLHQLATALADGHFPVRWMPDANYGYGYPFYNYYAPLSIYVAAAFRFLGFSFVRAIHLAQLAGFAVAGLGMFYLGRRRLGSRWAGLLAAVAYTVAPFHMVNVYVRGDSLAEFWAMAFYPLVLLAADGIIFAGERGRKGAGEKERALTPAPLLPRPPALYLARPVARFALAYAGLILSHNISALIFSPFLLLYLLIRLLTADRRPLTNGETQGSKGAKEQRRSSNLPISRSPNLSTFRSLSSAFCGLFLAFALAAWFFVPALAEQGLAQLGPVTEGYFHYSNHFRGGDLVQGGLLFDYNPDGGVAFRLGLAQVGLAVAGAVVLLWRSAARQRPIGRLETGDWQSTPAPLLPRFPAPLWSAAVCGLLLLAVFMITPLSRPLWDHLPLLPFTQFPWRFLSVASFFTALLSGGLVLVTDRPAARAAIALTGSLVLLAGGLLGLRVDHLILTDDDVTAERLAQYEWFTGNIGTTVSAEYLTPAATPRPWTSAWLNSGERDRAVAPNGELLAARLLERSATHQTWALEAGSINTTALFPTLNWPNWLQPFDSHNLYMDTQPGSGLVSMPLGRGEQTVSLTLGRTPIRLAAELASAGALLLTVVLLIMGGRPSAAAAIRAVAALSALAIVLLLLGFFWRNDPRALSPGDLTWDFAQMAYLHHDLGGVAFENGARLHEYGYSGDEIAAGDILTMTLSVDSGDGRAATLALVTPASARPAPDGTAEPPILVATARPLDSETAVFSLVIPPDAPPGLYVPRLTIDGARPLLPSGGTRGDLFLRPIRITAAEEETGRPEEWESALPSPCSPALLPACAPTGALDVRATSLVLRDATTLDGRFAWYTSRPLGARYQFSWRLQDAGGDILAQLDAQPGYGYQPSTLWPAGRWTADWLALRLPDTAPAAGDYPLVMRLYDVATGETILTRRVGVLAWDGGAWRPRLHEPSFVLPDGLTPMEVIFGQADDLSFALRGYRLEQATDALRLTLYWEALADAPHEYARFVHLLDEAGAIAAQMDGAPAAGSYPVEQWIRGEIVADAMVFDLSGLPPGEYRLVTGFYQPGGVMPRLPAFGPDGPLVDDRAILPESIPVVEAGD